ncbi:MAG: dihydropteroate synthase [Magnetococcales bacterium]|nr:dihydropteroate synthase [Magnetococcales bacterium]NGZ27360.1 dihydropteroate synthase [Magnetococcales bacterium]
MTFGSLQRWLGVLQQQGETALVQQIEKQRVAQLTPSPALRWSQGELTFERPQIMGVVNVTPDSFSDGGRYLNQQSALEHALSLVEAGADILDIGGESTRPGAAPVSEEEELARVVPVIAALTKYVSIPISIDTTKVTVAKAALQAGATILNDVAALATPGMTQLAAQRACPVILMHKQGNPQTMQVSPCYQQVVVEVYDFLEKRLTMAREAGIQQVVVDPGIGFGKNSNHNMALIRHLRSFRGLGVPILLGVSRKRLVGELTGEPQAHKRDMGSHTLAALGYGWGADIVRVHDVVGARQALRVAAAF